MYLRLGTKIFSDLMIALLDSKKRQISKQIT